MNAERSRKASPSSCMFLEDRNNLIRVTSGVEFLPSVNLLAVKSSDLLTFHNPATITDKPEKDKPIEK